MKILVADDESEVRQVIRVILGGQGHDILEAADGERTLEIAGEEMPGLILLDVLMPGKSGIDVLQELKGNRDTKSIPVIMVTALTDAQDENRAMMAGALDYVTKPWTPGELEDRIRISVPEFAEDVGVKKGVIKGPAAGETAAGIPQRASALHAPISTGSDVIDNALLGGIPLGSLTLIEGPPQKSIPVIMVTALTDAQDENRAMMAGALDYVTKPWTPGELEDRIRISVPEFAEDVGVKKGVIKGPAAGETAAGIPQRASALHAPISTGSDVIDNALLGGIPLGSLTLIEGPSGAGKSVLCQHIAYGAMMADQGVVFYTSGMAPDDLTDRMNTLGLDVRPFIPEGQLTIQPLEGLGGGSGDAASSLEMLKNHIEGAPWDVSVVIIDSLSHLMAQAGSTATLNFLMECKQLCRMGKAILISLHTSAFDPEIRNRLDALFTTHMTLGTEGFSHGMVMKTMNVIDIDKVRDTKLAQKRSIYFEVDTELGRSMNMSIKVLPIHKLRV